MFNTTLLPNFRKLKDYFANLQEHHILEVEETGGVPLNLEYLNKNTYNELEIELKALLHKHNLSEHYQELLYLIIQKFEEIALVYITYREKHEDDVKLKEVAMFIDGVTSIKHAETVQISIKPSMGDSIKIKNDEISKWMVQHIMESIENQDYPLSILGTQTSKLFDGGIGGKISYEKVKQVLGTKIENPKKKLKPMLAELCIYLQPYLINHTHLILQPNASLSDKQANFFFDLLAMLDYIDPATIDSFPKDYIYSLLANHKQ